MDRTRYHLSDTKMSIAPKIFFKIPLAKHGKENTMYMRFYFYLEILRVFHYE